VQRKPGNLPASAGTSRADDQKGLSARIKSKAPSTVASQPGHC
jgi:hypothetical protein